MKNTLVFSIATLGLLASLSHYAFAQDIEHIHLSKSETLQLDEVFKQALLNAPQYREIAARNEQAQSHEDIGQSWIAGRPNVQLDYIDDRSLSNLGEKELTYGIELPLWRPGQKREMQALGQRYSQQASLWQQSFTLSIAGQLRTALADLQATEMLQALEQQATEDARTLLSAVEKLFDAGEVAQLDVMQARSLLLAQQRNELAADARRVDAERTYYVLTGLSAIPSTPLSETRIEAEEVPLDHPVLQLLQSNIDLEDANISKALNTAKGNPTLTIGSRRQKADAYADYSNALALSISVPIGGKSFVSAAGSAARRAKVDAQVQYYTAVRELNSKLHEVEHELFTLDLALPMAREQAELSRAQWEMARSAFELGETDMSRVVIALQQARASAKEYETLSLQYQRLIIESNQIIGVLP